MFEKKVSRLFALVIALIMLLSLLLAGCGSKQEAPKEQASVASSSAASAASTETTKEKAKEPVTLKFLASNFEKGFPNGVQTDDVANEIAKRTGITIDWICGNNITDFPTYATTLIASGDLPDIINQQDMPNVIDALFGSNSIIPLDDLLKTNGQDILKNVPEMVDSMRKFKSRDNDGKVYFLNRFSNPTGYNPNALQFVPLIRWDLYKAIGMPEIKNYDDLLNVLKQMQDKFPTASNGKKAYALSGFFGDWGNAMPYYYFSINLNGWPDPLSVDVSNPDKIITSIDPQNPLYLAAEFINKANKMRIFDPDSVSMKFEQYKEKMAQGRIYCDVASWSSVDVYNPAAIKEGHPERGFEPLYGWNDNKPSAYAANKLGYTGYCITKNCKKPERAMDLLDFLYTYEGAELILNGIEGKHWKMVDGKPQVMEEVINGEKSDPDFRLKSGAGKYGNAVGFDWTAMDPRGFPVNFKATIDYVKMSLTPIDKDYCKTFNLEAPYQPWLVKPENVYPDNTFLISAVTDPELKQIYSKQTDYFSNNYTKLFFAKDFPAARDKFIADLKAMGYDKYINYYVKKYNEVRANTSK